MTDIVLHAESGDSVLILEAPQVAEFVFDSSGPQGPKGDAGAGVAAGGGTGQFLQKHSNADYDTGWTSASLADANFRQDFQPSTFITVTHNLGKYPAVTILTSAGDEVEADIDHLSMNQLTVTLAGSNSGTVICN